MDVERLIHIPQDDARCLCRYYRSWNGIPVFLARDNSNTRSVIYADGTSLILLSSDLKKMWNEAFISNRLWHEVSHLYYGDVNKCWDIRFDYRADIVASAVTGRDTTLKRLALVRKFSANPISLEILDKRIDFIKTTRYTYSEASVLKMVDSLSPAHVL